MGKRKHYVAGGDPSEEPNKRLKSASVGVSKAEKNVNSKSRQEKRARKTGKSNDKNGQEKTERARQAPTMPIPLSTPNTNAQENGEPRQEQHSDKPRKRRKRRKPVDSLQDIQAEPKESPDSRQVNGATLIHTDSGVLDHRATTDTKTEQHAAKHAGKRAKKASRKKEKADQKQQEEEERTIQAVSEIKPSLAWEWVQTAGGQMVDADPLFSQDEE